MYNQILVIVGNETLAESLRSNLQSQSYLVHICLDGIVGLQESRKITYDLIILEVGIPHIDGIELSQLIRKNGTQTPILMLLEDKSVETAVKGLNAGADAYLTFPFNNRLLFAQVASLTRRSLREGDNLQLGEVAINKTRRMVLKDGRRLNFKRREFDILLLLAQQPGRVFKRTIINNATTCTLHTSNDNTIDVHISNIRKKLAKYGQSQMIETVHGVGYRLNA